MSIKTTPRRIALLTNLISGFTATPEDDASVEREISVWITATAEEQGRKRSIVRRDLVLQNGYKGAGAQTRFASDLLAALRGQPEALLGTLREGDRDLILDVLPESHTDAPVEPVVVEPVVETAPEPVVEEAPVEAPAPAPVPTTTTPTQEWLTVQITEHGLIKRLATMLAKRDVHADYDDLCSDAGLWLATWGQKGTFDAVIKEKGSVPFSWLCRALERKRTSSIYKSAQDALARQRGARTQHEINQRIELGMADYVAPESLVAGDMQVVSREDDDGDLSHDFVDPRMTPEEEAADNLDREEMVRVGREIVASAFRGAVERYTAVYDAMIAGASTDEIAEMDGCTRTRAMTNRSKVRAALREGIQTRDDAQGTLALLRMEPWSTKSEIQRALRMDRPRLERCLAYLNSHGLIREGWGETVALSE